MRVLERGGHGVGGAGRGTGPDDDPMLRSLRGQSREEGKIVGKVIGKMEGLAEGERKGRAEGRTDTLAKMAHRVLLSRGLEVSPGFLADPVFAASSVDAVFEAASACKDEAEFLAALRPPRNPGGEGGTNG